MTSLLLFKLKPRGALWLCALAIIFVVHYHLPVMTTQNTQKLKVSIATFGCQMETDRDDSGSKDAEYV